MPGVPWVQGGISGCNHTSVDAEGTCVRVFHVCNSSTALQRDSYCHSRTCLLPARPRTNSEKLRLKLLTPLNLAGALLDAGGRVLGVQAAAAAAEGAAAAAAERQLETFRSGAAARVSDDY